MCNVDCPHTNDCTNANSYLCQTCANNRNHKHNHYQPHHPYDPYPWHPINPWYPHYPWIASATSTSPNMATPTTSNYGISC